MFWKIIILCLCIISLCYILAWFMMEKYLSKINNLYQSLKDIQDEIYLINNSLQSNVVMDQDEINIHKCQILLNSDNVNEYNVVKGFIKKTHNIKNN